MDNFFDKGSNSVFSRFCLEHLYKLSNKLVTKI